MRWFRTIPYVPQMELAECGAACLGMVLEFFGAAIPMSELRKACGVSRDGSSALSLLTAARAYGLECKGLKLELDALRRIATPVILHWNFNHFVVLQRRTEQGAVIVDPASGRRFVGSDELSEAFTGIVLTLRPGPAFRRVKRVRMSLRRYLSVLQRCRPAITQLLLATLFTQLLDLGFPSVTQILVDHIIRPARSSWLIALTVGLALATVVSSVLGALRQRVLLLTAHALDLSLVTGFVEHLLRLPTGFFQHRSTGDLMQRVESNATFRELAMTLVGAAIDMVTILAVSALLVAHHRTLGLLIIALNVSRAGAVLYLSRRTSQLSAAELTLAGAERSTLVESLSVPELIRGFDAADKLLRRYSSKLCARLNATMAVQRTGQMSEQIMALFDGGVAALVFWLGGSAAINGDITAGGLMTLMILRTTLISPFQSVVRAARSFVYARGVLGRLDDVLDTPSCPLGSLEPGAISGQLELRGVSFRHAAGSRPILQGIDMAVATGEKIAIVGRSGSGKTTLARVMLGLLEPTEGRVLVDGRNIHELDQVKLRRQITAVLQESFFFDASIRDNLTFGLDEVPTERLRIVLEIACMEATIAELPNGLDTPMGPHGARFSRGQRQRLALARALLSDPKILILDEATSSLDLETEAQLHWNLSHLRCTRIVIAHRLATVRDADRVLVVEEGVIAEQGSYDALTTAGGLFQRMVAGHA